MEQINWPMALLIAAIVPAAASVFLFWCCCVLGKRADRVLEEKRRMRYLIGDNGTEVQE